MKQVNFLKLIILLIGMPISIYAQQKVQIGDLYYNLSGVSAAVTSSYYRNSSYIIPESVTYNGLDFIVNRIDNNAFRESSANKIILPNTIKTIGSAAFKSCSNLTNIIIPASVTSFDGSTFYNCYLLRTIIYLSPTAPLNWTATTYTYVPDKQAYSSPSYSINDASTIEMITFEKTEFEYTGQAPLTTWINNVEGYTASLSMPALSGEAGDHEVWIPVTFTKDEESFTTNVVYRYTIKPAKLTAKVSNAIREYGEENPLFNITYSGFVGGENESALTTLPTISTTATKTSNVGEYAITVSGGNVKNYELVYEPGVLTITKAALSAKVNDVTKVYGSANPAFTIDYYGLKNGESAPAWTTNPTFTTDATSSSVVGQYAVKAINGVPVNYSIGEITAGTLSVTPAPLTIKANDAVRQYYSDEPTFSFTCNGFVNGDDESVLSPIPTISTSASRTSNVGNYEIKVGETNSPNYSISNINGTLTITPRTLTASVGNYDRTYNEENPAFEVNYVGFVGNDDVSSLNEIPTASTKATKTSDVGTYSITVSGGNANNYNFTYTPGTLTINKAEQTISWDQDLTSLIVGDQVELKAYASSGLPITYTLDNSSAAEIYSSGNKSYLDCKESGHLLIRAVQNGNKNYYSTPRLSNTVSIIGANPTSDLTLTIQQADNGSVKVQVPQGSVYTFTMAPSNGWRVHSVTFNDTDVTDQLTIDGNFTTPTITSNSTLSVVYEEGTSAVNSLNSSDVKIMATSGGIRVINANLGDVISIYTTDGVLLHSTTANSQTMDIPLTKHDIYIVKVGEKTMKLF